MDTPDSNTGDAANATGSFDLGSTLTNLGSAAGSIIGAFKSAPAAKLQTAPQGTTATTSKTWLIVGAIIAALTLLVIIIKR